MADTDTAPPTPSSADAPTAGLGRRLPQVEAILAGTARRFKDQPGIRGHGDRVTISEAEANAHPHLYLRGADAAAAIGRTPKRRLLEIAATADLLTDTDDELNADALRALILESI